ncbi:MAG: hypothetical protein Ct9H300mP16_01570 [Pseudomonadota bacterium]|nr:MAG: hypothetical protein Ct9H300mP16_01570 [Pseudomonadota bacterium]
MVSFFGALRLDDPAGVGSADSTAQRSRPAPEGTKVLWVGPRRPGPGESPLAFDPDHRHTEGFRSRARRSPIAPRPMISRVCPTRSSSRSGMFEIMLRQKVCADCRARSGVWGMRPSKVPSRAD